MFPRIAPLLINNTGKVGTLRNHCLRLVSTNSPPSNVLSSETTTPSSLKRNSFREKLAQGPTLANFLEEGLDSVRPQNEFINDAVPYVDNKRVWGAGRKVYFETYGCQMNVNDTEIAWSILQENGYQREENIRESDVVLVMTCSIREGAEQKIWKRLDYLKSLKRARERQRKNTMKIGIIGCMAERLKHRIVEREKLVDIVCGPDAYRDLPRMLSMTDTGQAAVNVLLSLEETYADVMPVRLSSNTKSAFVSIMRGCDNMCTYCIVPFTRGRERSRPIQSILEEVKILSEQGVKEVTLLGQNVNSYRDTSEVKAQGGAAELTKLSKGFTTVYKPKSGGRRFSDLLDRVSQVDPEMRIRFTSPHPKDFPDEVLHLIRERHNICSQLHLPAQSGSSAVLEAMRRGYTREAYIDLVHHVRDIIPDVSLSSDFIAGFCGETEDDHQQTRSLMKMVRYNYAFCFPYSMRQKTKAFHRLKDDVPEDVKSRRHQELTAIFREEALKINQSQIGQCQLILVEGTSKRSELDMAGRNDGNTKVIFPKVSLPLLPGKPEVRQVEPGDYVVVQIMDASSQVLKGVPLYHSSLQKFSQCEQLLRDSYFCESAV